LPGTPLKRLRAQKSDNGGAVGASSKATNERRIAIAIRVSEEHSGGCSLEQLQWRPSHCNSRYDCCVQQQTK